MTHDRFGHDLAQRLHDAENALDLAVAALGDLGCLMVRGRIEQGISAVVGQGALTEVTAALPIIVKARKRLIKAHHRMRADARALRIDWSSNLSGPLTKPEEEAGPVPVALGRLRVA